MPEELLVEKTAAPLEFLRLALSLQPENVLDVQLVGVMGWRVCIPNIVQNQLVVLARLVERLNRAAQLLVVRVYRILLFVVAGLGVQDLEGDLDLKQTVEHLSLFLDQGQAVQNGWRLQAEIMRN